MSTINFNESKFVVHPEGQHTGIIKSVVDKGIMNTTFGPKHKITVRIESDKGSHVLNHWLTVSNHPKSNLTRFREMVLGRSLTERERVMINLDQEFIGRRVGYDVSHRESGDRVFANVVKIWPITDDQTDEAQMDDDISEGDNPLVDVEKLFEDDELPF